MSIGNRIKTQRERIGLSQDELAAKLGYKSRSSISKIEKDGRELPQSKIKAIADALDTTPSYIMGWGTDDTMKKISELGSDVFRLSKGIKVPVVGEVAAGHPIFAEENYIGSEDVSEELCQSGQVFGLKIKGDSMSPRIAEGDTVIVRQQDDAESGDIVIVLVNGDTATCKRLMKYAEGISLISFNPAYEPMYFSNKDIVEKPVRIIGKVIENRQKY